MAKNHTFGLEIKMQGAGQVQGAVRSVSQELDKIGPAAQAASTSTQALAGHLARMGHLAVGAFGVQKLIGMADAVTTLENRLKLVTSSTAQAAAAYQSLFDIAQRSRVSFTELGGTFASVARAGKSLGESQQSLLQVTEAIGNAMTIGGGSAESMNAALVQLGQGLSSGVLRGEELNSVIEQTPRLAQALADGLGVSLGALRTLGTEGKLTAQSVIQALKSQSEVLQKEVAGATLTVGQSLTQLHNATLAAVGDVDKFTGASSTLAGALSGVAQGVGSVGQALKDNEGTIKAVLGALGGAATAYGILAVGRALAGAGGLAASIGVVRTAFLALSAAMAANPVGLALLGIGALTGVAIAYDNSPKGADRIAKEIDYQTKRIEKAEAQLAAAGGSRGGKDPMTAKLEARIDAMKRYRSELQNQAMQEAPAAAGAGGGRGSINPPTVGEMRAQQQAATSAWQASIAGVKTATSVQQDYNDKLKASRAAFDQLAQTGLQGSALEQAQAQQLEYETALATERDKALKSLEAGTAQAAKTLALQGKLTLDEVRQSTEAMLASYQGADAILQARRSAGLLDEQEYTQAKVSLIALERDARIAALEQENALLAAQKSTGHDALERQRQMAANQAQIGRISADAAVQAQVLHIQSAAAADAEANALKSLAATHQRYMQQLEQQQQRQLQTAYMGSRDKEHLQGQWAIEDKYLAEERRLQDQRMFASNLSALQKREIDQRLADLQAEKARELAIHQQTYDQLGALRGQWGNGLQLALAEYSASAADVAGQTAQAFTRAFGSMEDALVQFALTGKASFGDMAKAVIADIIRIQARAAISGIFGTLIGAVLPGAGGASGGNAAGGLKVRGFASGGYTGDGGKYEPAGIVHRGEYVINAHSTRALGLGYLNRLNGYAQGGLVGAAPGPAGTGVQGQGGSSITINVPVNIQQSPDSGPGGQGTSPSALAALGAGLSKAIAPIVKETIAKEQRPGGLLWAAANGR